MSTETRGVAPGRTALSRPQRGLSARLRRNAQMRATAARRAGQLEPRRARARRECDADDDVRPDDAFAGSTAPSTSATTWTTTADADDPHEPRLAAREVVRDEDVGKREESHRQRKRREHLACPSAKSGTERHRYEPGACCRVDDASRPQKSGSREQRAPEDVLVSSPRACRAAVRGKARAGSRPAGRKPTRANAEPQPYAPASSPENRAFDDEDVDVRKQCNSDEADDDRPEITEERRSVPRAGAAALREVARESRKEGHARSRPPRRRQSRKTAPPSR